MSLQRELIDSRSTSTPSIGSIDLNYDPSGNRVRQIVQQPVMDSMELKDILGQVDDYANMHAATRKAVRLFAPNGLLTDNNLPTTIRYKVEAQIPLTDRLQGLSLVYLGHNDPSRSTVAEVFDKERQIVEGFTSKKTKTLVEIIGQAITAGYILESLTGSLRVDDHQRLIKMYSHSFINYPFDIQSAIREIVASDRSRVYAARNVRDGQLYAVCVFESLVLKIPGLGNLTMSEMGDSAKMPESSGLNAPLKLMLTLQAAKDEVDLLFTETRACLYAVNWINHSIGMRYSGFLPKHTLISGPQDVNELELDGPNGTYGNMNVWTFNKSMINETASRVQDIINHDDY